MIVLDPRISNSFTVTLESDNVILFSDGIRGVELNIPDGVDYSSFNKFKNNLHLQHSLREFLKENHLEIEEICEKLIPFGCIVESHEIIEKYHYNAEYLAHRLVYYYRVKSHQEWGSNKTLNILYSKKPNKNLALGFLFETFHHIKGARWTSVPVLAHKMDDRQREILERFFLEERNHYMYIAKAFEKQGYPMEKILNSIPSTETELLERHFYSCANMSVLDFSSALIVPEVDEYNEISNGSKSLFENLVANHGIDSAFIKSFKMHDEEHEDGCHSNMPLELISLESIVNKNKAKELIKTVDHTINAYSLYLNGIYNKYASIFKIVTDIDF